jgi:type I restriction enzyme S subunit
MIAGGKIKREKTVARVMKEDEPFKVPIGWTWVRLDALTQLITKGSSPKWQGIQYVSEGDGVLFVTSENVGNYRLRKIDQPKYVEKRFNEIEPRSILKRGDILLTLVGASIGRTAVYDLNDGANINQAVALIRLVQEGPEHFTRYLLHYFNSPFAVNLMLASRVTTAQPNISLTDTRHFPVPIPPLAEQQRIVARVDELMALCDGLETQLATAQTETSRLLESVLHHALTSPGGISDVGAPTTKTSLHSAVIHTNILT